ncbi:MAG TPA: acyl-CoA synthetase [Candidatus Limnocylindrales bacterium]|nr:acyl-CoA synthetase [Candidatus Limnocylindrales bacterium]
MSEYGFWNLAARHAEALALVTPDGQQIRAGELAASSNALVRGMRALGLERGDAVATVLPNGRAMIELYLAAFQSGLYLTPINHHLTGPEIAYILSDCEAQLLVGDARFAAACATARKESGIAGERCFAVGSIEGFGAYSSLSEGQPTTPPADRTAGQVMNYTSGTTGRPKGVRRRLMDFDPDMVGSMYAMFLSMFGIEPLANNVHLVGSPLYHTAVLMFTAGSLHYGHTVVLMDKWTPESALEMMQRYRVTTSHMVPTQFHRLLALPEETRKRYDLASLRHMIHAAAPCPVDVKTRMLQWWGPVVYEYYAASEGGGTLVTPEEWMQKPGTVGRAWAGSSIRILDDDGNECPAGTPGTVYMAMGSADFEYHKDKAKTEANRKDGFFTVGDIGYLDEDGYLFLCDRKIDMIIAGGVNIYPTEIENTLLSHPMVGDAAVFGIPNEDLGEEVKAVIEPAANVAPGPQLAAQLDAFCKERLAKYKCPRSYDFVTEMPRDPNGKLFKRKLRDPYWEGRERRI